MLRKKVKEELTEVQRNRFLTLTMDIWTCNSKSYLSLSVHYLNNNWEPTTVDVSLQELDKPHCPSI